MITKKQRIMIIFAVFLIILAILSLFFMKKLENDLFAPVYSWSSVEIDDKNSLKSSSELQEEFDELIPGGRVADLYEGVDGFWFTGNEL